MAKEKNSPKTTREQRQRRAYQITFIVISVIVLLTMVLSLIVK
jgi:hypothetical protein